MQRMSEEAFTSLGLSPPKAYLLAARLRHGATTQHYSSEKQKASTENAAWMDRVLEMMARLEILGEDGIHANFVELAAKTNHGNILKKLQDDEDKIKELVSTAKSERKEGFLTCRTCKGTKVDVDQMQTRSADEPMTLFALCTECGTRWTMK